MGIKVDNGSGPNVATDVVGSDHYQVMKLALGGTGAATLVSAGQKTKANSIGVTLASDTDPVPTVPGAATGGVEGSKTANISDGVVALAGSTAVRAVIVRAKPGNTGRVTVGITATPALQLSADDWVAYSIDNLNKVHLSVTVDGEGVDYSALT